MFKRFAHEQKTNLLRDGCPMYRTVRSQGTPWEIPSVPVKLSVFVQMTTCDRT